jgi:hypothetical protein
VAKNTADEFAVELNTLAERLNRCKQVTRFDTAAEKQAWVLAHSLLDLAESFRAFLNEQMPRLRDERLSCDELHDALIEIGEEFRHILYHVRDPEFYAYLRDDVSAAPSGDEPQ